MELESVEDFEAVVARYEECFQQENHDRPVVYMTAPAQSSLEAPPAPATMMERWYNFDWRIDCFEVSMARTRFLAEAFPSYMCNLGPDVFAAFTGSRLEFAEGTSWAVPHVEDWESEPPIRFDPECACWKDMERFLKLSAERGEGKWITASGDIHSNADGLSAMRRPAELCIDLLERPEEIERRLDECLVVFREMLSRHFEIIHPHTEGVVSCWIPVPVRGKYTVLQNDFCCMVSPEMFRRFFEPSLRAEAQFLDRSIFHWDGPGALQHLDAICDVEEVHAIQWVYGAGHGPMSRWIDLLKRLQDRGKGLWIGCGKDEVKPIMEALRPEGVMLRTSAGSVEEAEAVVREAERVCAGRRTVA